MVWYRGCWRRLERFFTSTTSDYIPALTQQRADATALVEDATGRGWDSETERHLKLINRINDLITAADARGQAM